MKTSFVGAVPFFGNTPDETHCVQATIRSALKYFLPERDFSWDELDVMSAKVKGLSTWPAAMLMSLIDLGFEITMIEAFDARAFIKDGGEYLKRTYGKETADWQIANSDISKEQERYQQLLHSGIDYHHRVPTTNDIQSFLDKGYLVKCTVNMRQLNDKPGYVGHSVLALDITDDQITFHDPGLPQRQNRQELLERFEQAWASPNQEHKELIAIKYKG